MDAIRKFAIVANLILIGILSIFLLIVIVGIRIPITGNIVLGFHGNVVNKGEIGLELDTTDGITKEDLIILIPIAFTISCFGILILTVSVCFCKKRKNKHFLQNQRV